MKSGKFKTETEYYIEEAIRFLVQNMPRESSNKKPVLLHSLSVGNYLKNKGCSRDSIIAGFLHDLVEDSKVEKKEIELLFGKNVASIVLANSKDMDIEKEKRLKDSLQRCIDYGQDALLVKAADLIDNYSFYKNLHNTGEMIRAISQGKYLLEQTNNKLHEKHIIFKELQATILSHPYETVTPDLNR